MAEVAKVSGSAGRQTVALEYRHLSLAVVFNSTFLPFDIIQFLKILPKQAFIVVPEATAPMPFGARLDLSGVVARKGEVAIRIDSNRNSLTVLGPDLDSVVKEMDAVESLIQTEFNLRTSDSARYYEYLFEGYAKTKGDPLRLFSGVFGQTPIMQKFSKAFGGEVFPFGIRLAPKGTNPNETPWAEFSIQPLVQSPTNFYSYSCVFRHAKRDAVLDFTRGSDEFLKSLVRIIEEGQ